MASRFPKLRQILGRVHNDLSWRWRWYRQWHEHPNRHLHHQRIAIGAGIGGLATVAIATFKYLIILGLIGSISFSPLSALAASQTWTSQSDWGNWTLSNTTAADNPGSVQLSTTSGPASWADDAAAPSENYAGVWAADTTHAWFGTSDQTYVEFYNGSTYAQQGTLGLSATSIWGSSNSDVWALTGAGSAITYHYNGSSWSSGGALTGVFYGLSGTSSSDVWAVGSSGTIYHYNGSAWSEISPSPKPGASFRTVIAFSTSDAWAAGDTGIIRRWTGASWGAITSPSFGAINGIWGVSSTDLWIRANDGNLYHTANSGSSWTTNSAPGDNSCTESGNIWGSSTSDIWTPCKAGAVLHYNGSSWSTVATPAGTISKLYGTSSTNIWGVAGTDLYHYTGSTVYQASGTASITYTPSAGQFNDWTTATPTTTTPASTTATVEYSHDNATWVSDIASVPSSESLYIRATLATSDTSVTPSLDAITVNYDAITTTVSSPNGGENIQFNETGDTTTISWTATGTSGVDHIHLQYSTNSGGAWSDVPGATALAAGTTSYAWNMPDTTSSTVRVKVILENSSNAELDSDTSNADFTITYDTTLPTFSAVSATSNNPDTTRGKSGDVVTVTFTASETLAANPTVTLGTRAMTFSSVVGLNYTYTRTLDGTETEGSAALAISGTDGAGNIGSGSGSFTTDFTNPTFSSVTATSNNPDPTIAKSGNVVTLTFTASETLLANPTVTIGTKAMTFSSAVGLDYTYTRTLDGTETAGASAIAISASDLTSNAGTGSGSFTLDFTNPSITIASPSGTGTYTTGASSIGVSGTASDNNTLSTVTSNFAGAVTGTASWSQTVSLSVGANTVIYTATDSAGNTNTATIVITRTDNAGPGFNFIAGTSNNAVTSVAKVGDIVTITFTASETLLANPTVTLGGQAATFSSAVGLDYTYTRTITGTEAEGSATIAVSGLDLDSNPGSGSGSFTLDFTAPTFSSVSATSNGADTSRGKSGNIVTLTFTSSETLSANPTVTLGTRAMTYSTNVGLAYTYTRTLDGTETEGSAAIAIAANDTASNPGTGSGSFTTDFTNPTFSAVAASSNNTDPTIGKSGNIVTITFTASETLLANPTVTLGTRAATFSSVVGLNYTYTRTLDGTETEGSAAIAIAASDLASNAGTGSGTFTLDFTSPSFSAISASSNNATTSLAKSGNMVTLTFTASETVTANPTVTLGTKAMTYSSNVGLNYTYTRTIDGTETDGSATISISGTDSTGNTGTSTGSFTLDFTAPSISVTSPATTGSYTTRDSNQYLAGTASDSNGVTITSSVSGSVSGTTNWSQTIALVEGANSVTYTATDGAGNTASTNFTVTKDSSRPAAPGTFDVTSCNTSSCSLAWGQSSASDRAGYLLVARTNTNFTTPTNGVNYAVSGNQNLGGVSYTWIDNGNTTTGTLSSLASNTLYYFAIYTVDAAYNYSDSKTTSGTTTGDTGSVTATKPDPVQDLTAFVSSSSIRVQYRALSSGLIADIYRSTNDSDRGNKLTATTTNSYEDTTAQKGVTYYYTVIARRTSDNGESDERQVTGIINPRFSIAISVAPEIITARPGEQIQLKVTTYNSNGGTTALPHRFEVTGAVGSVNGSDVFTAGPAGDYPTGLKAIVEDGSSYSEVIVPVYIGENNHIISMGLSPSSRTLKPGESWTPALVATNQNGTKYDGRNLGYQIKWQATGGSINNNGTYTAGNNTGEYEITGLATKSNEQWLIRGFVTISNEALRLEKVIMTNSLRIPPDTTGRFYTYGYDQFDNILTTYGPGGKHVFSNNDPAAGVIDPAGIFHASQQQKCSEWNIRSDHYAGSRHLYIMGHVDTRSRSNAEVIANDNFRRVGMSSYSLTVKPGGIQQYSGWVINGWNQIVTNEQVIFSLGSNGTSEAGTITENGYFVAGNREGVYANVVKIKSRDTKTGAIKNLGSVTLLITPEDQTLSAIATASATAQPFTFAFSNPAVYNQFGATFQGRKVAVRPSIVNGGGVTESPWMMEVGGSGTFKNTIKGTQFVGGSLESATARQGSLFIKNDFSLCSLTGGGGDDGGYFDDDGNWVTFIDSPNLYLPDSRLDRLIKDAQRTGGGDTGDQIIPINRVRQTSPWRQFITHPLTQKVAKVVALISTLLTALLAITTLGTLLWELISRFISWLTNGLHSLSFLKRDQAHIGRVIDNRSRRPVAQATVTLINAQNKAVIGNQTTDNLGRYQFIVETGQAYIVKVEHPRYDTQQLVLWNNPHRVFRLGQKIEFNEARLVSRRRLTKLFNWLDGFRVALLIAGTVSTIILGMAGVTTLVKWLIGYYIFAWMLEAYIRTKPRPFGVVVDAETKQPLDLVVVRIFTFADKLVRTIVTDQQGRFRTLMSPAYYKLTFTKVGFEPLSQHKYIGRSVQFLHIDAALTRISHLAIDNRLHPERAKDFNQSEV